MDSGIEDKTNEVSQVEVQTKELIPQTEYFHYSKEFLLEEVLKYWDSKELTFELYLLQLIDSVIFNWGSITSLSKVLKGYFDDPRGFDRNHLYMVVNHLRSIEDTIIEDSKNKVDLYDSKYHFFTHAMRTVFRLEVRKFRLYFNKKMKEINTNNTLE